jgi:TRAP-type C4-dicarboxylate transport system permease small subunit
MLDRLLEKTEDVSRVAVWIAGGALLLSACMVSVDVILRKLFSISMAGADEITGYVFAVGTTWAFTFTLLERGNVRIDALYQFLPRPVRAGLDIFSMLVLGWFMLLVTKAAYSVFYGSLGWPFGDTEFWSVSITPLLTPLAIPQGLWFIGLLLFMFAVSLVLVRSVVALAKGDFATVARVAGPRTQDEEVAEEIHLAEASHAESVAREKAEKGEK